MTLIIAARGRKHVVVMADGLSLRKKNGGGEVRVEQRDLAKLFVVPGLPALMAHHGQNELGALPVSEALEPLLRQDLRRHWEQGLNEACARTILRLDNAVCQTLKGSDFRKTFGIWLAGFWPCTNIPEVVEIYWQRMDADRVRAHVKPLGDVSLGGTGGKYLRQYLSSALDEKYSYDKVFAKPVEYSMEFVKLLYTKALEAQARDAEGEEHFGGEPMMALITPDGVDLGSVSL